MKFFVLIFTAFLFLGSFSTLAADREIHDTNIYWDGPTRDERAEKDIDDFMRFMLWSDESEHSSGRNMRALINLLWRRTVPKEYIRQVAEHSRTDEYMNSSDRAKKRDRTRVQIQIGMYFNRYIFNKSCAQLFEPSAVPF